MERRSFNPEPAGDGISQPPKPVGSAPNKTEGTTDMNYWLCAVFNCAGTPELHTVRNPARLGWQPVMAIEHYRIGPDQIRAIHDA